MFNKGLEIQKERYEKGGEKLSYAGLCKELTSWKHQSDSAFLAAAPSQVLQQALKDLERSYENFFAGRAGFPKFKKRGKGDSFRYPDPKQIKLDEINSRIFLPKLGWFRYRKSRKVMGSVRQVTVSWNGSNWFVSIQTEEEVSAPKHPSSSMVGVDLGVVSFAVLSDGSNYSPVNSFRKREKQIARCQRRLARKQKFSANWRRQKERLQKIHTKVANIRREYLHKTSTTISKNHAIVVIEDLQVRNMCSSASGTVEKPGRNVRAKSGLNKSILDQGWYEFRRQLEYKQNWRGGAVVAVSPQYTSQKCSLCRCVDAESRSVQSTFSCVRCGYTASADFNAARNILAAGLAVIACGGDIRPEAIPAASLKQEPTVSAV